MFKQKLISIILICILILTGCSSELSIENQAYVLVLGVDIAGDGMIELTIQIPKIGTSTGSQDGDESKDSAYLIVSAKGRTYQKALEALKWSATRELNLSQIKMIVFSEEISKKEVFSPVVSAIAETYHLYTAARLVICNGSAKDFIRGHETVLGTRLSDELDAMFDHYSNLGYIPDGNFAEFYYTLHSFYSDPIAIWAFPSSQEEAKDVPASAMLPSDKELTALTKTPSSRHYLGAIVFREGMYAQKLTPDQTLMVNLLTGNLRAFNYDCNGQTYQFTPLEKPRVQVSIEGEKTDISIRVRLSSISQDSAFDPSEAAPIIEQAILRTIRQCQSSGIEPFGFANKAACRFLTIDEWIKLNWHECFRNAHINVNVHIMRADS